MELLPLALKLDQVKKTVDEFQLQQTFPQVIDTTVFTYVIKAEFDLFLGIKNCLEHTFFMWETSDPAPEPDQEKIFRIHQSKSFRIQTWIFNSALNVCFQV